MSREGKIRTYDRLFLVLIADTSNTRWFFRRLLYQLSYFPIKQTLDVWYQNQDSNLDFPLMRGLLVIAVRIFYKITVFKRATITLFWWNKMSLKIHRFLGVDCWNRTNSNHLGYCCLIFYRKNRTRTYTLRCLYYYNAVNIYTRYMFYKPLPLPIGLSSVKLDDFFPFTIRS